MVTLPMLVRAKAGLAFPLTPAQELS